MALQTNCILYHKCDQIKGGGWTILDETFKRKTNKVYNGSYSGGIEDGTSSAKNDIAYTYAISGGKQTDKFSFYWIEEESGSSGGGIKLQDSSGNDVCGFATDNDQWIIYDNNGNNQVKGTDDIYNVWNYVEFTFDWTAGTFDYYIERLSDNNVVSGTGNPLINTTDIEKVLIKNYGGDWSKTGYMIMRFDDIILSTGGTNDFKEDFENSIIDYVEDATGNGNDGQIIDATFTASGKINGAIDYDGSNDYIEVSTTSGSNLLFQSTTDGKTIGGRFYFDNIGSNLRDLISAASDFNNHFHYNLQIKDTGKISIDANNVSSVDTTFSPSTGTYHFIAARLDIANSQAIVDFNGSRETLSIDFTNYVGSPPITIGMSPAGGYNLDGRGDEIGIWDRLLSDSEVDNWYNGGAGQQYPFGGGITRADAFFIPPF